MKLVKRSIMATVLTMGVLAMGSASALTISAPGVSSATLQFSVQDGVATLYGAADSGHELILAERALEMKEGIDRVINIATFN